MVGFAPGGGHGAVGEGAAAVPGGDGFADVGWEDPGGAADVEYLGVGAEQDGRMSASQAILRMVLGWIGPVKVAVPVLTVFRGRG